MPDVRLIDATRLHAQVFNDNGSNLSKTENVAQILLRIENAPTIDAQPVKHGHWIIEKEEPMYGGHRKIWALRCSECRKDPIKHIGGGLSNWWFQTPEFCPVCGADMRGEANEEK